MNEPKPNSPSEALALHVNVHGEIHLNAEMSASLLNWVRSQEKHLKESIESIEKLLKLVGPLLYVEQVKSLQDMFRSIGELTRR